MGGVGLSLAHLFLVVRSFKICYTHLLKSGIIQISLLPLLYQLSPGGN